jgi:low temperature requirement protein LtrA
MRGIEVPERTEDFTADPVELFFDLAYVFAFNQLVGRLVGDHTWGGVGETALLFGMLWLPWQQLTWAANVVSGNGRRVRIIFLVATAVCVPMAAATSTALDTGGPVFAASLVSIMFLGFAIQALSAQKGTDFGKAVVQWIGPNLVAVAVMLAGAVAHDRARIGLWCASLAIVLAAMIAAGRNEWLIRSAHFAERHALIVIIALGEVVVAIGVPVVQSLQEGRGLPGRTVVALVAAGVFAGLLWWAYFDRPGPALEHRAAKLTNDRDRGRYVRDVYTWAHAPIVAGLVLSAASLEQVTLHPASPLSATFRVMLAAGLLLGAIGVTGAIWRAFRRIPHERLWATAAIAALAAAGSRIDAVLVLVGVDAILVVALAIEHRRIERPS